MQDWKPSQNTTFPVPLPAVWPPIPSDNNILCRFLYSFSHSVPFLTLVTYLELSPPSRLKGYPNPWHPILGLHSPAVHHRLVQDTYHISHHGYSGHVSISTLYSHMWTGTSQKCAVLSSSPATSSHQPSVYYTAGAQSVHINDKMTGNQGTANYRKSKLKGLLKEYKCGFWEIQIQRTFLYQKPSDNSGMTIRTIEEHMSTPHSCHCASTLIGDIPRWRHSTGCHPQSPQRIASHKYKMSTSLPRQ